MTIILGCLENIFFCETVHKSYRLELLKAPTPSAQDKGKNFVEESAPPKEGDRPNLPHVEPARESDTESVQAWKKK